LRDRETRYTQNEFEKCFDLLSRYKSEFDNLPNEEKRRIDEYTKNRRAEQFRNFLEGFQIRQFKIQHIGPAKLAVLTSYGIETAADVSSEAVQNVPGFGPINSVPLVNWRRGLEGRFVYNPNPTKTDKDNIDRIKVGIRQRATEIQRELATAPDRLRRLAVVVRAHQAAIEPMLQTLYDKKEQILVDLRHLGLPAPASDMHLAQPATVATQNPLGTPSQIATAVSPKCPLCGSRMMVRTARRGGNSGQRFYGCASFPSCRGTRPFP
jgi:hypothetical protein